MFCYVHLEPKASKPAESQAYQQVINRQLSWLNGSLVAIIKMATKSSLKNFIKVLAKQLVFI